MKRLIVQCLFALAVPGLQGAVGKFEFTIGQAQIVGVATDPTGFIYIAGTTSSAQFTTTPGPFSNFLGTPSTTINVFVRKIDPVSFSTVYSVLLGGTGSSYATGIAVDGQGEAVVTGYTNCNNFTGATDVRAPSRTDNDVFVFKLNASASALVYSRVIGGTGQDFASSVALGPDGSAAIAGNTNSADLPVTPNAVQSSLLVDPVTSQEVNAFVGLLNPTGTHIDYLTYLGGPGAALAFGVAVDSNSDLFVTGTAGAFFPTMATSFAPNLFQGGFLCKIDHSSGQFDYSTYLPGTLSGNSLLVDASGDAYIAGDATAGFPATVGAYQTDLQGGSGATNAFVLEMNAAGQQLVFSTLIGVGGEDAVALALSGDVVVIAGTTGSTFFPVTDYGLQFCDLSAAPGNTIFVGEGYQPEGIFVSSFDHKGALLTSVAYGDCSNQAATALGIGASGLIYLTGTSSSGQISFLYELDLQSAPPVEISAITDSAAFQTGPFAPFQLISVFGKGLGPKTPVSATLTNGALPTALAGTQVFLNNQPLPLLFVSDTQINAVLPNIVQTALINIWEFRVVTTDSASEVYSEFMLDAAPTLFTSGGLGYGQVIALNQDGTVNSPANPATRGSIVSIFGTGGGITNPLFGAGQIATQAAQLVDAAGSYVDVGLVLADILYIGAAPGEVNGVVQLNVRVPDDSQTGPAVLVRWGMYIDGDELVLTQSGLTMAVK